MKANKILGILKLNPLVYIGVGILLVGNIVCYNYNGRLMHIPTNIIIAGLVLVNLFQKRNHKN